MRCFLGQKWLGFRSRETTWWLHRIMRCKRVENIPPNLSEANNKMLRSLWTRIFITENNLNILHKSMKRQKFGKNYLFTTKFKGNSLMSNSLLHWYFFERFWSANTVSCFHNNVSKIFDSTSSILTEWQFSLEPQ